MNAATDPPDLSELVDTLDPDKLRAELRVLAARERALRVLLRAAIARRRAEERQKEVAAHA